MTTLLVVSNSEGVVGRCDANCYCAHDAECTCICGGKNHRVGLAQAIKNTQEMLGLDEMLGAYAHAHDLDPDDLQVSTTLSPKAAAVLAEFRR